MTETSSWRCSLLAPAYRKPRACRASLVSSWTRLVAFDHQLSVCCLQDALTFVSFPQVNETPLPPADPARLMLFLGSLKSKSANGHRGTVRDTEHKPPTITDSKV